MTKKTPVSTGKADLPSNPHSRPVPATAKLPGTGIRRDLKETWGSIKSKTEGEQSEINNSEARLLKINRIATNPNQPRRTFDGDRDAELAADVKERGILEPILVRAVGEDEEGSLYQIVAGERRFRAALAAGLTRVPVIIKNYNDNEARFTSLVENLQRLDLDPLDEAYYFRTLSQDYNYSYRQIAKMVNRSPAYISERLKRLPGRDNSDVEGEAEEPAGSGTLITFGNNGDLNHKRSDSEQKLKVSQSTNSVLKPVLRFREYINRVQQRLVKLKDKDRDLLAVEIKELQKQLARLEEEISKPPVSRETPHPN